MNWIQEVKKEAQDAQRYIGQLETRNKELVAELSSISVGFVLADQPEKWDIATKLQDRAARILKKLATQPLMARPSSRWW